MKRHSRYVVTLTYLVVLPEPETQDARDATDYALKHFAKEPPAAYHVRPAAKRDFLKWPEDPR
jgi:hypothetical protein